MKSVPRWVKATVTAALLLGLALGVDWARMPDYLSRLDWLVGGLAVLAVAAEMPVNAWKWWWALRLHDARAGFMYLFRTGCFAFFFNNFLPSAIGGDIYRVLRTSQATGTRSRAISAVLVERMLGLAVMLAQGLVGAAMLMDRFALAQWYVRAAAGAVGITVVISILFYMGVLGPLRQRLTHVPAFEPVFENVRRIGRFRVEWLGLLAASVVFQLLAATVVFLAFLGIGEAVSIPAALLITAAAGLASVLPISISGMGVVEGSIAGVAVALGTSYDGAVLAAIVIRLVVLPVSAACGLLYLTERNEAAGPPASVH